MGQIKYVISVEKVQKIMFLLYHLHQEINHNQFSLFLKLKRLRYFNNTLEIYHFILYIYFKQHLTKMISKITLISNWRQKVRYELYIVL